MTVGDFPLQSNDDFPIRRYAHLSLDGKYRYVLERTWGAPGDDLALFVMLNPSTADAHVDDATIRRCMGFARRWHLNGIRVVNLYAYRATNPKELSATADPEGVVVNNNAILRSVHGCRRIICAWGASPGPHVDRPRRVYEMLIDDVFRKTSALNEPPGPPRIEIRGFRG